MSVLADKKEKKYVSDSQKVWWKRENGHEWEAVIYNRNKGRGGPECAKERRKKKNISDDAEKA